MNEFIEQQDIVEPHSNTTESSMVAFNIKDVEEAPEEILKNFDFSGPLNAGITGSDALNQDIVTAVANSKKKTIYICVGGSDKELDARIVPTNLLMLNIFLNPNELYNEYFPANGDFDTFLTKDLTTTINENLKRADSNHKFSERLKILNDYLYIANELKLRMKKLGQDRNERKFQAAYYDQFNFNLYGDNGLYFNEPNAKDDFMLYAQNTGYKNGVTYTNADFRTVAGDILYAIAKGQNELRMFFGSESAYANEASLYDALIFRSRDASKDYIKGLTIKTGYNDEDESVVTPLIISSFSGYADETNTDDGKFGYVDKEYTKSGFQLLAHLYIYDSVAKDKINKNFNYGNKDGKVYTENSDAAKAVSAKTDNISKITNALTNSLRYSDSDRYKVGKKVAEELKKKLEGDYQIKYILNGADDFGDEVSAWFETINDGASALIFIDPYNSQTDNKMVSVYYDQGVQGYSNSIPGIFDFKELYNANIESKYCIPVFYVTKATTDELDYDDCKKKIDTILQN